MQQKLAPRERAAIIDRIAQINLEREFPKLTEPQKSALEREHVLLAGKIQRDELLIEGPGN